MNKTPDQRATLDLPPMPLNDNHLREDATSERPIPIIGIYAIYAFGIATGLFFAVIYAIFFTP